MKRSTAAIGLVVFVVLLLILAACLGGGGDSDCDSAAPVHTSTVTQQARPVTGSTPKPNPRPAAKAPSVQKGSSSSKRTGKSSGKRGKHKSRGVDLFDDCD